MSLSRALWASVTDQVIGTGVGHIGKPAGSGRPDAGGSDGVPGLGENISILPVKSLESLMRKRTGNQTKL